MRRNHISTILLLLFVSGFIIHANAFDGKRSGFILGGGIGPGMTSYSVTTEFLDLEMTSDRENKFSIITNFMIGGGVSKSMLLYYLNRVSWLSTDDEIAIFGLTGLGLTYYFSPKAPSGLIKGGFGISSFLAPFEPAYVDYWGIGFLVGTGFEFSPHWSVEGDFVMGWPTYEESGLTQRVNVFSVQLTFNGIAY